MRKKLIAIVSESRILFNNLSSNIGNTRFEFVYFDTEHSIKSFLLSPQGIDVLIIETDFEAIDDLSIYSKYIYSFIRARVKYQIDIKKPMNLARFMKEILYFLENPKVFCVINDDFVYCELKSTFSTKDGLLLKLSNIENMILKSLILAQDHYISKETLQSNVWKYASNSETKTIEQKMQYLRSALPKGLLRSFADGYKMFAKKIS